MNSDDIKRELAENRHMGSDVLAHLDAMIDADAAQTEALYRAHRGARFVAEHWRDAAMEWSRTGLLSVHPLAVGHALACVLRALDGETDPAQLGINPDAHEAFRAALEAR